MAKSSFLREYLGKSAISASKKHHNTIHNELKDIVLHFQSILVEKRGMRFNSASKLVMKLIMDWCVNFV